MSTYTPISSQVLGSTASSVTFTSIPQNYTDLRIVISAKANTTAGQLYMQFNDDTSSNYSRTMMWNNNNNYGSNRDSNYTVLNIDYYGILANDRFNTQTLDLMQYSNSSINKVCMFRCGNSLYGNDLIAGLWRQTAAIQNITIFSSQVLAAGTSFSLYGIANASTNTGKASGGNIVTTDGTYWYHAFTSSGVFTPTAALNADVLVVAGGGGAGGTGSGNDGGSGGGGAGGYRLLTSQSMTTTAYTITVGSGGAGGASNSIGSNGSNSQISGSGFSTITSSGGGAGSAQFSGTANNGGSGGGGGWTRNNGTGNSGGYTPVEGYAGGVGGTGTPGTGNVGGGGGGGAGGAGGGTTASNVSGAGGIGSSTASSWGLATNTGQNVAGTVYFAGGGSGGIWSLASVSGTQGYGGGASGVNSGGGNAGTANTGGGGGGNGANTAQTGGSGGSGIVIVRYAV